jgi:hypothetical protein
MDPSAGGDEMTRTTFSSALLIVAALLACKSNETAAPKAPEVTVSTQELLLSYKSNEVAADQKYKGKRVRTTGVVNQIKKDIVDEIYVTLGTGAELEFPEVQAYFPESLASKAAGLRNGQTITVDCNCEGLMVNVQMKECLFVGM